MNVEHGTFTPLVFSLTGGEGPETSMFHKYIAQKYCEKNEKYEKVLSLIRCKLFFLILRSDLICVRGSRAVSNGNVVLDDVSLIKQFFCFEYLCHDPKFFKLPLLI